MKISKIVLFCSIWALMSNLFIQAQKPQKILGLAKEDKSIEYYQNQSSLWQEEIRKKSNNGEAWINYYRAERAKLQLERPDLWPGQKEEFYEILSPIIDRVAASIPNTFDYYFLKGMNSNDEEAKPAFLRAYEINPEREEVYGWLLVHYVYRLDQEALVELSKRMLKANIYNNASLMWNYNALQSIEDNGLIVTNGDMDSLQKWVLQYGEGIRKDVLVINRWMLAFDDDYRQNMLSKANLPVPGKDKKDFDTTADYVDYLTAEILTKTDRPAYMSTGTGIQFFRQYNLENQMYIVGNAIKYSKKDFNNTRVIKDNFENKFYLEYLLQDFQNHSQNQIVKTRMNITYLPGLFHLKEHYDKSDLQHKSAWCSTLIDKIAEDSGRKEEVLSWFK